MRQMISIFFLFLFCLAFTEAGQFAKIHLGVQHYYAHQKDSGSESLLTFLKEHYWSEHRDDGDQEEDNRLPFKTTIFTGAGSILGMPVSEVFSPLVHSNNLVHNLFKPAADILEPLIGIFHPPQSAK